MTAACRESVDAGEQAAAGQVEAQAAGQERGSVVEVSKSASCPSQVVVKTITTWRGMRSSRTSNCRMTGLRSAWAWLMR